MKTATAVLILALAASAAALAAAGGRTTLLDRDKSSGSNPPVYVKGESDRPKRFLLKVKTTPSKRPFQGTASLSCRDRAYNFADRTRPLEAVSPAKLRLRPTKPRAAWCSIAVSGSALISPYAEETGRVTAALLVKRRH
jgi:hypothetical protein